jgi:NAD(P)-dependent dehydrogenase (short-subunit alcohol dehydrogenase family)
MMRVALSVRVSTPQQPQAQTIAQQVTRLRAARNREAAEAMAKAVRKHGVQACTVRANAGEPAAIDRMCEEIVAAAGGVGLVVSR